MDFVPVGLVSPPPRRPKGNSSLNSSLPPLLSTNEVSSPRRRLNQSVLLSPRSSTTVNQFHSEKPLPHPQQPAQVASWPLTFASDRSQNESLTVDFDPFSPISPKMHKLQTRSRLIDESRTRPALLQELQEFLRTELKDGEKETFSTTKPSLRRLQVVREALSKLVDGFSVYAPVLLRIRDEYENTVEFLYARSLMVPGLQTRLQNLETHCLRQLSASSAEAKARSVALQRRLAETQALLTASAAENARLTTALKIEKENVAQAERKLTEFQKSTLALASSVRRHDESLRAGHERSLEDARALEKVTARYYHTCDELAELKKTVAALEEQGNGEHVAADKNTISLLTRELQELSAALAASEKSTSSVNLTVENDEKRNVALNHAFVVALDTFGLELELSELLDGIANASTIPDGVEATAALITQRLKQVQQQHFALRGSQSSSLVFLTEPVEMLTVNAEIAAQFVTFSKASGDFLSGRGMSLELPSFLQHDGFIRNLFFPRVKIEQLVAQIWDQLDEQQRAAHNRNSTTRAALTGTESSIVSLTIAPSTSLLTIALDRFLQRSRDAHADRIELVYNFLAGLERFSSQSSSCRLFHLIFSQKLPLEARNDQIRELTKLHEALVVVDHDRHFVNSSLGCEMADSSSLSLPPGRVSLADVVRTLRLVFPWKSDTALSQLHRALIIDLCGQPQIDYTTLLSPDPHVATKVKCQFSECLKMQRLDDLLTFRRHVQNQIQVRVSETVESEDVGAAKMISLNDLRVSLQTADSAMSEPEITRILVALSGLNARELLTHDDMMLDTKQVLQRLATLLIKPTGRFTTI